MRLYRHSSIATVRLSSRKCVCVLACSLASAPPRAHGFGASLFCSAAKRSDARTGAKRVGWKFEQHENGWTWCRSTDRSSTTSTRRFSTFIHAERDAMEHGYVPGVSHVSAIGESAGIGRPLPRTAGAAQSALVIRHRTRDRWVWELRGPDGRVVLSSSADFATRAECEANAARHGLKQ